MILIVLKYIFKEIYVFFIFFLNGIVVCFTWKRKSPISPYKIVQETDFILVGEKDISNTVFEPYVIKK